MINPLVACFLAPQNIVDVQNVVTVLIVVTVILDSLARLRQNSPWVSRGFVVKARVAYPICSREVRGQGLERL